MKKMTYFCCSWSKHKFCTKISQSMLARIWNYLPCLTTSKHSLKFKIACIKINIFVFTPCSITRIEFFPANLTYIGNSAIYASTTCILKVIILKLTLYYKKLQSIRNIILKFVSFPFNSQKSRFYYCENTASTQLLCR